MSNIKGVENILALVLGSLDICLHETSTMVIHRRSLFLPVSAEFCDATQLKSCSHLPSTLQTKVGVVHGYLWGRWPRESVTYYFDAECPCKGTVSTPLT